MTRFTPAGFARACGEFSALSEAAPAAVLAPVVEASKGIMAAASAQSGGVKAPVSQFSVKKPKKNGSFASAAVVGFGFAVLDEYGSYKKPMGWDIDPSFRFSTARGGHQGKVLTGWSFEGNAVFTPHVHHPALKAHPFQAKADVAIGVLMDKGMNAAAVGIIRKAFG